MNIPNEKNKFTESNKFDELQLVEDDDLTVEDLISDDELVDEDCISSEESKVNRPKPFFFQNYNLSILSEEERERFIKMQINEEQIGNFYLSYKTMYNEHTFPDYIPHLNKCWGFPATKAYWGWIYDFKEVTNEYDEDVFYLEFLANSSDIVRLKFRRSFSDVIYNSIKNSFRLRDNIFHKADFSEINRCAVCILVDNIRTSKGTLYSNVLMFKVINNADVDLIIKIAEAMLQQSS